MDVVRFGGFLDGINESLKTPNPVDTIVAESEVTVDIDLEKLYYNMVAAKADWLYNLPQWDALLTEERRKELYKAQKKSMTEMCIRDRIHTMETQPLPIRMIAPGRVFRADELDATHSPNFHQIEGLVVDKNVTFADLKGTLAEFAKQLFGEDLSLIHI